MQNSRLLPFLLLLLVSVGAGAQPLARRVSLSYRNEALGVVLDEIGRKYQVLFSYSSYYIPVDQRVSIAVTNVPLRTALDTLFSGTPIVYASIGDQIVLRNDRERMAQLAALRKPAPAVPLIDERSAAERRRLSKTLPELNPPDVHVASGGNAYGQVDLEKFRKAIAEWQQLMKEQETEEAKKPARVVSNHRMAQVSLLPFLGTNALFGSEEMTNNLSLNLFWGSNSSVDGVEVGSFVNTLTKDLRGVQIAGAGNTVGGTMTGTQVGGLFNVNRGKTEGVQVAGLFNATRQTNAVQIGGVFNLAAGDASGVQVSGLFNIAGGRAGAQFSGLFNTSADTTRSQVAGLFNAAGDIKGAQISAVFNKARRVHGIQIGLINSADTVSGISLGLLNLVRRGYNRLEVAGGEGLYTNIGLKLGTRSFYNILHVGARWDELQRSTGDQSTSGIFMSWGLGYGLGTAITFNSRWMMNIEAVAIHVNEMERWTRPLNLLNQLRLTVDYRPGGRVSFFTGPVGNLMVSKLKDPRTGTVGSSIAPYALHDKTSGETNVRIWVGVYGGVRF